MNYAEKNNGDFVGWCERKPNPSLPTEAKDDLLNKTTTPQTSPIRSRSDSTPSSPVSLSPNPIKCSSPQQFLQNWLQLSGSPSGRDRPTTNPRPSLRNTNTESSSCNKRQRETENTINRLNKRVCLDKSTEENGGKHSGETSSAQCEASLGNELSEFHTDLDFTKGSDKENVDINLNSQLNSEQSSVNTKSRELSEKQSNTEFKDNGSCSIQTSQSDCKNIMTKQETDQSGWKNAMTKQNGKKSNWLRDMGVKKNKVSRKIKLPSQPSSPQLQEPSSPSTEFGAVLKNMRSIRDYFTPVSRDEDSPSKHCIR